MKAKVDMKAMCYSYWAQSWMSVRRSSPFKMGDSKFLAVKACRQQHRNPRLESSALSGLFYVCAALRAIPRGLPTLRGRNAVRLLTSRRRQPWGQGLSGTGSSQRRSVWATRRPPGRRMPLQSNALSLGQSDGLSIPCNPMYAAIGKKVWR